MHPVTLEISGPRYHLRLNEISALVGSNRLYLKGTNRAHYLDCRDREEADLLLVNLRNMDGVKVRILGDPLDPPPSP